ncbi:MAG: hypothetical protein WCC64_07350 [Aliidongia sp.]
MPRNALLSAATLALLAGCGPGWPLGQHPDPNAAQTVRQAEPLVQDCERRFKSWLGTTAVTWDGGANPSITRTGDSVSIRLAAMPTESTAIDPLQYSCDYDGGETVTAGPVP